MRITQGCFSFLPDLTDEQIRSGRVLPVARMGRRHRVHRRSASRNTYWEMWGHPMFDLKDAKGVMMELDECRKAHGEHYIKDQRLRFLARVRDGDDVFIVNRQRTSRSCR
jgi:ribulose-bisphosphate carboxylase small chain